jgi:hypothetical protein
MRFSVYLAGKIPKGSELDGFSDWRSDFRRIMESRLGAFPLLQTVVFIDPHTLEADTLDSITDFFGRDAHMVSISSAVLVDAREKIGAGTAQEMLIAKYYGKPVVTVIPRGSHYWRDTFVHGCHVEYKHPFLFETSDAVVRTFEEAADWLLGLFSGALKPAIKDIGVIGLAEKHYLKNHIHKDPFVSGWKREMEGPDG